MKTDLLYCDAEICLEKSDADRAWKMYRDSESQYKGLYVEANITHADKVINGRIYFHDRMEKAVKSLSIPYRKPILINHDTELPPVGRIVSAKYMEEPGPMGLEYARFRNLKSESVRDLYVSYLIDNHLFKDGYQGTGCIRAGMDIGDPQAIERIMDERYLTLSTGFETDSLKCSYCQSDRMKGGGCEHSPGEVVDGIPVVFLTGDLKYKEVSFVNVPADPGATVVLKSIKDSSIRVDSYNADTISGKMEYFRDKSEDVNMYDELISLLKEGKKVKLEDLMSCENLKSSDIYGLMNIPESARLSSEQLDSLDDSNFCRSGKIFPVVDLAHFQATKDFLKLFEEGKEKDKTVNKLYYRARKIQVLPTNEVFMAVKSEDGSEDSKNISTPGSLTDTFIDLKEAGVFDKLDDSSKELFEKRMKILNIGFENLENSYKEYQKSKEDVQNDNTKDVVEQETSVEVTDAVVEEVKTDVEEKKELSLLDQIQEIFKNLEDSDKEEFLSTATNVGSELMALSDKVASLDVQLRDRSIEFEKRGIELNALSNKVQGLRKALVGAILDLRMVMNKPSNKSVGDVKTDLESRSDESLIDSVKDLHDELSASFGAEDVMEDEAKPQETSTSTAYKSEPVSFKEFAQYYFGRH